MNTGVAYPKFGALSLVDNLRNQSEIKSTIRHELAHIFVSTQAEYFKVKWCENAIERSSNRFLHGSSTPRKVLLLIKLNGDDVSDRNRFAVKAKIEYFFACNS